MQYFLYRSVTGPLLVTESCRAIHHCTFRISYCEVQCAFHPYTCTQFINLHVYIWNVTSTCYYRKFIAYTVAGVVANLFVLLSSLFMQYSCSLAACHWLSQLAQQVLRNTMLHVHASGKSLHCLILSLVYHIHYSTCLLANLSRPLENQLHDSASFCSHKCTSISLITLFNAVAFTKCVPLHLCFFKTLKADRPHNYFNSLLYSQSVVIWLWQTA